MGCRSRRRPRSSRQDRAARLLTSKIKLQRCLAFARNIGLAGYCAEIAVAYGGVRSGELHMIEGIERFEAELQAHSLPNRVDREIFEYREVGVGLAGLSYPGKRAWSIAQRVRIGLHEHIGIRKVLVD